MRKLRYELVEISYNYSYKESRYSYPTVAVKRKLLLPISRSKATIAVALKQGLANSYQSMRTGASYCNVRKYQLRTIKQYCNFPTKAFRNLDESEQYCSLMNFYVNEKLNLWNQNCKVKSSLLGYKW